MTQQELDDLIEQLEAELEEANDLKTKAIEDNHDELIKTANTQIVIIEAKLWGARHKQGLSVKWEDVLND